MLDAIFSSVDGVDKERDRAYIKNIPNVGRDIFFFGLRGIEPAFLFIPPVFVILAKPSLFFLMCIVTMLIWMFISGVRCFTPRYRWKLIGYLILRPKRNTILFPRQEWVMPFTLRE